MARSVTIPDDVAEAVAGRLRDVVAKIDGGDVARMMAFVPRRNFLYVYDVDGAPVCRLRYHGDPELWGLQMYLRDGDRYDIEAAIMVFAGGTPEECMEHALEVYKELQAPGEPGDIAAATRQMLAVFRKFKYHMDHDIFIVPQQCYLYVEVREKPWGSRTPSPPLTQSSTTHKPLGRLKYEGAGRAWECQPYRYSDEYWDDGDVAIGTPGDRLLGMLVEKIQ